jgi:hypothetical protein
MSRGVGVTRQRFAISRTAAGAPRTYRMLPLEHGRVQTRLREAARGSGALLNSFMVVLGDTLKLYPTGQYRSEQTRVR